MLLTDQAVRDLNDIGDFIAAREGEELADAMLDRLEGAILSLAALPDRGDIPPELERIGVLTYRELHEKPYRILYRREANTVFIHAILDARRDVQSLLGERVLR
ncbi:MAG: type II toxin-antitoxin system RelE/ParE family toxin [Desulfovibrionaceae bacterium]